MIKAEFFSDRPVLGFHISGHSDYSEEGSDIVCAAVSSAAYMVANTITEIMGLEPALRVEDGEMYLKLTTEKDALKAADLLSGFRLHMNALTEQYQKYITVTNTEV